MNDYFYGWYFRCQGKDGCVAVIPAVHFSSGKSSCSIQIITKYESLYKEFPISQFRFNRKRKLMQIGESLFSTRGIRLNFEANLTEERADIQISRCGQMIPRCVSVRGVMCFGVFSELQYDIMGPFAWVPGMECKHKVYSMKHTVNGYIRLNDQKIVFQNDLGYMEGDNGTSFPEKYIWTQHFFKGGSLMTAAALIPIAGLHFTGTIGFVLIGNKEYRFATYLGARVKWIAPGKLLVSQGRYHLMICLYGLEGQLLKAPERGNMVREVRESIACSAEYTLTYGNHILLHEVTHCAAAEYDMMLPQNHS